MRALWTAAVVLAVVGSAWWQCAGTAVGVVCGLLLAGCWTAAVGRSGGGTALVLVDGVASALASGLLGGAWKPARYPLAAGLDDDSGGRQQYGVEHALLHLAPEVGPEQPLWCNMGWWPASTLAEAGQQLAAQLLADSGLLNGGRSDLTVIDLGFGCGDQLVYWLRSLTAQCTSVRLIGVTSEPLQRRLAERKVAALLDGGQPPAASVQLLCGSVDGGCLRLLDGAASEGGVDWLVCLDSAYHFARRERLFRDAHRLLRGGGGALCLADIVLGDGASASPLWRRCVGRLAGIPLENLVTVDEYRQQLLAAGFQPQHVAIRVVNEEVFAGFRRFLLDQVARLEPLVRPAWLLRYRVLAFMLDLVIRHRLLNYVIVSCHRSSDLIIH